MDGAFTSLSFGDAQTVAAGADSDPYHFAMLDSDSESGTDHAVYRQYSSTDGSWMSPDPYMGSYDTSNPQSFNRYAYVSNSPLMGVDPLGMQKSSAADLLQQLEQQSAWASAFGGEFGTDSLNEEFGYMSIPVYTSVQWGLTYIGSTSVPCGTDCTGTANLYALGYGYQMVGTGLELVVGGFGQMPGQINQPPTPAPNNPPQNFSCPAGTKPTTQSMLVTGYDNSYQSTGKNPGDPGYGITANGQVAGPGTIAAPRTYPFGTQMFVPGYGPGTVTDRGGAIKNSHIDLWFSTTQQAINWGAQHLMVTVCQ